MTDWFLNCGCRLFRDGSRCLLDNLNDAFCSRFLLREILVSDFLGQLLGNGVGWNANIDTFPANFFN
jgi:hypothetical protein